MIRDQCDKYPKADLESMFVFLPLCSLYGKAKPKRIQQPRMFITVRDINVWLESSDVIWKIKD